MLELHCHKNVAIQIMRERYSENFANKNIETFPSSMFTIISTQQLRYFLNLKVQLLSLKCQQNEQRKLLNLLMTHWGDYWGYPCLSYRRVIK